jgi:hypothetical protein
MRWSVSLRSAHHPPRFAQATGHKRDICFAWQVIALETAGSGVTANCINPGWVLTPLVQAQLDRIRQRDGVTQEGAMKSLLGAKQPSGTSTLYVASWCLSSPRVDLTGEFVTPTQLGEVAVFLCSSSASQITGLALSTALMRTSERQMSRRMLFPQELRCRWTVPGPPSDIGVDKDLAPVFSDKELP